jgi:anti-sigma B factor antagonist
MRAVTASQGGNIMGRRDSEFATGTRQIGDFLVISLTGELDMASAPEFEDAIDGAQGGSPIIVDLRGLTFIDSMGIRALLRVYAAGQNGHSTVSFIRARNSVQRILQIAGVDQALAWTTGPEPGTAATSQVDQDTRTERAARDDPS